MAEEFAELFARIRSFGWDNNKRDRVLRERGIDFDEVRFIFDRLTIVYRSDRKGEVRYLVFGFLDGVEVAVICTFRDDVCWIYQRDVRGEMKEKNTTIVSRDAPRRKGKTDWAAVDALTDKEIEASIANDPDWQEFADIDWSQAVLVVPPKKKAISIRLDADVLDYFKKEGAGYQRRMNAVLRSFVQQKRKKRA